MLFIPRTREEQHYKKRIEGKEEEWTSVLSSSGEEVPGLLCPAASACSLFLPILLCEVASNTSTSQHACLISPRLSLSQSVYPDLSQSPLGGSKRAGELRLCYLLITHMEESDGTACPHSDARACGQV